LLLVSACADVAGVAVHERGPGVSECPRDAGATPEGWFICWTSVRSGTPAERSAAEARRKRAAQQRAASPALREAEARACSGVHPDDLHTSPFEHVEDIARIVVLRSRWQSPGRGFRGSRPTGALVTFRRAEGMTVDSLQRVVDCHLARNAALGHAVPELPSCPLVPRGVRAQVSSTSAGLAVTLQATHPRAGREIARRVRSLRVSR
jgi:hypothetical protein